MLLFESLTDTMPTPQIVLALVMAFSMLAIVLELVRRQKLREEYTFLWISTALVLIVLALSPGILVWFSELFETQSLVSMLYFGAFAFLLLVALQFSVRLTKLTFNTKTTGQRIALLEAELASLRKKLAELDSGTDALDATPPLDANIESPAEKGKHDKKVS